MSDCGPPPRLVETKRERSRVSVKRFVDDEEVHDVETHPYDPKTAERQIARTRRVRAERDAAKHNALTEKLIAVAKDARQNIMPITIAAVGRTFAR
jgi:2-hydroxyisobutanoyl-CoA mutase large subunit